MRLALALGLAYIAQSAMAGWTLESKEDAMTDKVIKQATVRSAADDTFTILRKTDGRVWGYFRLAPAKTFSVGDRLTARVDKFPAREENEDGDKLFRSLGMKHLPMWEWNPSVIGFVIWHGIPEQGCGWIHELYGGEKLVIRHHEDRSTVVDTTFPLGGDRSALLKALDLDLAACKDTKQ